MHELQHRKGSNTRDRILDVAEAAILEKGFAATSIDELIVRVFATWWQSIDCRMVYWLADFAFNSDGFGPGGYRPSRTSISLSSCMW